ncbi:MAG: hypothetical protein CVV49_01635 [Spirochaetae bacterium HGW-Spirochaetae-5]|nr:MAG: hypothetical protein CVV49_01635 [Spirochaetae bacterium HGW-Spirochaetae-5]
MKKIVIISVSLLSLFFSTQLFAKSGFSLGVFGSYAIDGGSVEDTIRDKEYSSDPQYEIESDEIIIPGGGVFVRYDFSNNLFIRTGFEYNELVYGGKVSSSNSVLSEYSEYEMNYRSYVSPLFFGINATPDKGKTNIYVAIGIVMARFEIRQDYVKTIGLKHEYRSDSENFNIGLGGIIGIEKRIMQSSYILIEYSFYSCEVNRSEEGQYTNNGNPGPDYEYTEKYGLPRQQIRLGLRYAF